MTNDRLQRLNDAGINVSDALNRFMGNENLLEKFLKKFLEDKSFEKLREALDSGDSEAALAASHTLKGVCGNLSMGRLADLFTSQVKAFRSGDFNQAKGMMDEITVAYNETIAAISE